MNFVDELPKQKYEVRFFYTVKLFNILKGFLLVAT